MATSTIPNPNPEVITIPLSINSQGATGSGEVKVCGRVATISASIRPNTTGTELALAWLQGGSSGMYANYAPSSSVWLSCDFYTTQTNEAEAKMGSDTNLRINTPIKDVDLKISGTWITKG